MEISASSISARDEIQVARTTPSTERNFGASSVDEVIKMALDELCSMFHLSPTATGARSIIRKRLAMLAEQGQRSPEQMKNAVLGEAGLLPGTKRV